MASKMNTTLGTVYSTLIDVGMNTITKNRAFFLKLHLRYPHKDDKALLRDDKAYVMEIEDVEHAIGKVERKKIELAAMAKKLHIHFKGGILCH